MFPSFGFRLLLQHRSLRLDASVGPRARAVGGQYFVMYLARGGSQGRASCVMDPYELCCVGVVLAPVLRERLGALAGIWTMLCCRLSRPSVVPR